MLAGVSGDLLSHSFSEQVLPVSFAGHLGEDERPNGRRVLRSWWRRHGRVLGPASSVRDLFDLGAVPMFEALGHEPSLCAVSADPPRATALLHPGLVHVGMLVVPWGIPLGGLTTELARHAIPIRAGWGIAFNGTSLRLLDLRRAYARRHIEFDIEAILDHLPSFHLLWACLRAAAFDSLLASLVEASARHGVGVCTALRTGVLEGIELLMRALLIGRTGIRRPAPTAAGLVNAYEQAITVAYRVLFLLFAESRGLLPGWHPVYRGGYSVAALRSIAERPGLHRGFWETLQAISRMAHAGCHAGDLHVTAFNGRLFAPSRAQLAEHRAVDDGLVGRAVVALTTRRSSSGLERIAFRDLGVEQLGAVYESVLDYEPAVARAAEPTSDRPQVRPQSVRLVGTGTRRKASGTFYTPAAITAHLVRETLGPLVNGAPPEAILRLKVVDPAMGSGAFLVAACRYLAEAYERAVVRETGRMPSDITDGERAEYRRLIAQRCLYGVDVNPMAVQVARLSMWLTTLAADRPLTFLDHHMVTGDSLVGASLDDVTRQRPGHSHAARGRADTLPFDPDDIGAALREALPVREVLATRPDETAGIVRDKESTLRRLTGRNGPVAPLTRLADAWCAWWFWDDEGLERPLAGEYADLMRAARGRPVGLAAHVVAPRLAAIDRVARGRRFFHWTLAFPEVFYGPEGQPLARGGFDAVISNPPWEMIRGDTGNTADRARAKRFGRQLTAFARESGVYRAAGVGHLNLYQLFVERAMGLTRPFGRVGLVVPWGLLSDCGSSDLRRHLFERCDTGTIVGFENTAGIFPVHRSVRFVLLTSSPGSPTRAFGCRFGLRDVSALDGPGERDEDAPSLITPGLLTRLSGDRLAVPWVRHIEDLRLIERLTSQFPALGDEHGWHARFGRELNATDDAHLFEHRPVSQTGHPVVEGRQIEPFRVDVGATRHRLRSSAKLRPDLAGALRRWRLGYRDVASATNRLTVIAALVPPGAVTVHTVFCLKTSRPLRDQHVLCAILNSFVLNFCARLWVTTHVTTDIVERLPAPCRSDGPREAEALGRMAIRLRRQPDDRATLVRLQATVARLYKLSRADLSHVLGTFPLIDARFRADVLAAFEATGSEV